MCMSAYVHFISIRIGHSNTEQRYLLKRIFIGKMVQSGAEEEHMTRAKRGKKENL
jgi:hypothetical protein